MVQSGRLTFAISICLFVALPSTFCLLHSIFYPRSFEFLILNSFSAVEISDLKFQMPYFPPSPAFPKIPIPTP